MTKIDLKTIIPIILENIDFNSYLLSQNYSFVKNLSNKNVNAYHKNDLLFEEIVYISLIDTNETYFSSTFKDSGNIINFVKNRIEIDGTYSSFNPKKNNLIEACKKLIFFKTENISKSEKKNLNSIKNNAFLNFQNNTFTYFYQASPIYNTTFLSTYSIYDEVIHSPFFKDRIFNTEGLTYNNNELNIINTAFPIYDINNKETGLVIMNTVMDSKNDLEENIEYIIPTSDTKKGFWISNNYKLDKRSKTKLTIVDSPIEALSHYQVYEEERLYVSFFEKTEKSFGVIYKLAEKHQANVHFASVINIDNLIYELRILIYFLAKKYAIKFNIENHNQVQIQFEGNKNLKLFIERIQRVNNRVVSGVVKTLGDQSKPILEYDIIRASKDQNNVTFSIPRNMQMLYEVTKSLINTYPIEIGLTIEKSTNFSWNSLNKKHPKTNFETLIKETEIFGFKNAKA